MTLPTGTVTFLFTDIEGSTKLWEGQPEAMRTALARHDELLRSAIERHNGYVFKTVGDAFCAAFHTTADGLNAALSAHLAIQAEEWGTTRPIRVRMALHTGEAQERDCDYFGPALNRAARLQSVAHGQQTLLSLVTAELVRGALPPGVALSDLGEHRLKDLSSTEHVFQLNHSDLPCEFPPLNTLDLLPTNLPQQLTSFVGREKEMAEIELLLQHTNLLTLTGSGGTGKTRLAIQAAAVVLDHYTEGVWLVELAALSDGRLVPQTVANTLNIREAPGEPISKTLLSELKNKQMLLVLDNCEHLLDASVRLVNMVLQSCPKIKVLVSSRETLGILGETAYRVPSLSLPDSKLAQTAESVSDFEAVRLFTDRAAQLNTGFRVTDENAAALASMCKRLDGIPLAIELAAARARSLSVEEINAKLDQRFRLLTGGSRTAVPRQQTLRSLIDWSYDLLNVTEKAMFCRLSVFAGGWTLEAAEVVCAGVGIDDWDVLDLLTSLSDKSLVAAEPTGATTRYRLLETVRQYARDRLLENGESEVLHERHSAYCLSLTEEAESNLRGPQQEQWLKRLEEEHDNLRAALEWSLQGREQGTGNREESESPTSYSLLSTPLLLCGALARFWLIRGYLTEGRNWCERALDQAANQVRTRERAKVLNGLAALAKGQDDYTVARSCAEESQTIYLEIGDWSGVANALQNLANIADTMQEFAAARAYHEQSLAIRREIGEQSGIANSLLGLGTVADQQGDYVAARAFYQECLIIKQKMGDKGGVAKSYLGLGIAACREHDYVAGRFHIEEGLALSRQIGDRGDVALSLHWLGMIACSIGDHACSRVYFQESVEVAYEIGQRSRALDGLQWMGHLASKDGNYDSSRKYYEQSLTISRDLRNPSSVAYSLLSLGQVACARQDFSSARGYFEQSLPAFLDIDDREGVASSVEGFAAVVAAAEAPLHSARLLGAAERLREEIGTPLAPGERSEIEQQVAAVRAALSDDAAFDGAWAEGRAMTMEEAIELALKGTSS